MESESLSALSTGASITNLVVESLSEVVQNNVTFTVGQVFVDRDFSPSEYLAGVLDDGSVLPLQVNVKATHADGSVRHAVISGVIPELKANSALNIRLVKSTIVSAAPLVKEIPNAEVLIQVGGVQYKATLADTASSNNQSWLSGPITNEFLAFAPLKDVNGNIHPRLTVRFGVRSYAPATRLEITVENNKAFTSGERYTYDVAVNVDGNTIYNLPNLTHYHHSRWHKYFWIGTRPEIHVQHNTAYLIASRAVPNYDQTIVPSEATLVNMGNALSTVNTGPMTIGTVIAYMGMTGGRDDIGPMPSWAVNCLLSMDKRAYDVMMANADGSGSWSMHLRDENTGYPLRTDNDAYKNLTLHPNAQWTGPMPVPRMVDEHSGETPYAEDIGHEPSLVYLPYLLTGDLYYLEEMQFWSVLNPLGTSPENHGYGQGLLRWHQIRGQAWALRALGEVAYITPDSDPMKAYFNWQVDNNLNFYTKAYVEGNPNKLGVYDGSGDCAAPTDQIPPWQDDYITWAFGRLAELGYSKAQSIFQWKAKFAIGRMTAPGYCWIMGAPYQMIMRDTNGKVLESFADVYKANFGGDSVPDDLGTYRSAPGMSKFIDLPFCSQAQADYLNVINGGWGWPLGRMNGLSGETIGHAASFQPTLALVADSGIEDSEKAWATFQSRTVKPDFRKNPQWNIVPRKQITMVVPPLGPINSPATQPDPAPAAKPTLELIKLFGESGTWKQIGIEGDKFSLPAGTVVRYGVAGKSYIIAKVLTDFVANNATFGTDPVPDVVKTIDQFVPEIVVATPPIVVVQPPVMTTPPVKLPPIGKPAKIKTPSNKKLVKLKGLTVDIVDPTTKEVVKSFNNVTAASTGIITLTDAEIVEGNTYAVWVSDAKNVLDIMFPVVGVQG